MIRCLCTVYPHRSSFLASDVPLVARHFNYPLHLRLSTSSTPSILSLPPASPISLSRSTPNLILDTLKRGEDDHFSSSTSPAKYGSTIIVRVYESLGGEGRGYLEVGEELQVAEASVCDVRFSISLRTEKQRLTTSDLSQLLERDLEKLEITKNAQGGGIRIPVKLRGFEVKTFKLSIKPTSSK